MPDLPGDEDTVQCPWCDTIVPEGEMVSMADETICEQCYDSWLAITKLCTHKWDGESSDYNGNPGRSCEKCGLFEPGEF